VLASLVIVVCFALAAMALAVRRWVRLGRAGPGAVDELIRALRARRESELESLLANEGGGRDFVRSALDAPGDSWVRVVNQQLSELGHDIATGSEVPRAAARISLACGTLVAVIGLATTVSAEGPPSTGPALAAFGTGLAGAIVALEVGRRATLLANEQRRRWDKLADAVARYRGGGPEVSGPAETAVSRAPLPNAS
jgi:hypothetical protein